MTYRTHLSRDNRLKPLIDSHGPLKLVKRRNLCYLLCASIISQQLGTAVAKTIKQRFTDLFNGDIPGPEHILGIRTAKLRSIGLSAAKASYIHNVARFAVDKGLGVRTLNKMTNEEVIEYLTQIKGVGPWTAEMQLMFTLGRPDVFSAGDGGIRSAMTTLYRLGRLSDSAASEKIIEISGKWAPYRTYACMHLWKYKDSTTQPGRKKK